MRTQRSEEFPLALALLLLGLSSVLLPVSPLIAETSEGALSSGDGAVVEGGFVDTLDVRLVTVDVWVSDRKGNPVAGLGVEDFEVFEDGQKVEISHFAASESGRSGPGTEASPPSSGAKSADPDGSIRDRILSNESASGGHLILYFDNAHLQRSSRKELVRSVRDLIEEGPIAPERILVLSRDQVLRTEVLFGSSREQLEAGLDRILGRPALGNRAVLEKRQVLKELQSLWEQGRFEERYSYPCEGVETIGLARVDQYGAESRYRVLRGLEHLSGAIRFLAALEGRKALVYLSEGLEVEPGLELLVFADRLCPLNTPGPAGRSRILEMEDLRAPMRALTRHANANRITLYTLDAQGLRAGLLGSAETNNVDTSAVMAFESSARKNLRNGLTFLADETGGQSTFDRNRFDSALISISRDIGHAYSLAFAPTHGGDGREHEIEVRLKTSATAAVSASDTSRKGFRIRYRKGYRDKSPNERIEEKLESALYLGAVSNRHGMDVEALSAQSHGDGRFRVPLRVKVPIENLVFLRHRDIEEAHLLLHVATRDSEGRPAFTERRRFVLERPPAGRTTHEFRVRVEVGEGEHMVALALRDEASGEISVRATTLEVRPVPALRRLGAKDE